MGNQYNTLAHMLLVVHDPTIPQLGPAHKQSRAVVDVRNIADYHLLGVDQNYREWFKMTCAR